MEAKKQTEQERIIEQLRKIRWIDKFHTFSKLIPEITQAGDDEKDIINNIVEDCCTELIRMYGQKKPPTKAAVRSVILRYMDAISYATVNTESKDFGYEMCWYIAEKINVTIRKYTETKVYGYWTVENNRLKEVSKRGKKARK